MKTTILHARLTQETKDKLEELAKRNHRSITNMIEVLIQDAYEQQKNTPDQ